MSWLRRKTTTVIFFKNSTASWCRPRSSCLLNRGTTERSYNSCRIQTAGATAEPAAGRHQKSVTQRAVFNVLFLAMTIQKLWFGLIFSIIRTGFKTPTRWAQQFSVYISRFTQCPYYFWSWGCSNSLLCLHIVSCCRHSVLMINCDTCCDYQPSGGTCWKPTDRETTSRSITAATSVSSSSHQTAVCDRNAGEKAVKVVWNQLWTESDLFYSDSLGIRGDKASIPFGRSCDIMTYLRGHACIFFLSFCETESARATRPLTEPLLFLKSCLLHY